MLYDNQGRYAEAEPLYKRGPRNAGKGVRSRDPDAA